MSAESSGRLTFHLDKLRGLVRANTYGDYELTDDGKGALRLASVFNTLGKEHSEPKNSWKDSSNTVWAVAINFTVHITIVNRAGIFSGVLPPLPLVSSGSSGGVAMRIEKKG